MTSILDKICSREEAQKRINSWKSEGKVIGYSSGAFDLLHSGHVSYLEVASQKCDKLIVGLNSDSSIKQYKSPDRPVCGEKDRALVLAALESVDCVFIFEEKNNNKNIEILRPDIYFKAGDYTKDKLSSASIIESYGGRVELIPFKEGKSTTSIIEKLAGNGEITHEIPPLSPAPILFLDRDGTLIEHVEYIHEPSKVKIIPGVFETLKKFQDAGYRIAIVTNQPGIGLGYFTKEDFFAVNRVLFKSCKEYGVHIAKIYYCPFTVADKSPWMKPAPGMLERGLKELNGIREKSVMIGDNEVDIGAGKAANVGRVIFVGDKAPKDASGVEIFKSIADVNPL